MTSLTAAVVAGLALLTPVSIVTAAPDPPARAPVAGVGAPAGAHGPVTARTSVLAPRPDRGVARGPTGIAPAQRPEPLGRWRWPLDPAPPVLRRFAVGPHPWSPGHRGVDLGAGEGARVLAPAAGRVAFAGRVAGRGVLSVDHPGGIRTSYEPVEPTAAVGDEVAAGAPIATLAGTAGHCAPVTCLHWGARRGDVYVDPLLLLGLRRPTIALLPSG